MGKGIGLKKYYIVGAIIILVILTTVYIQYVVTGGDKDNEVLANINSELLESAERRLTVTNDNIIDIGEQVLFVQYNSKDEYINRTVEDYKKIIESKKITELTVYDLIVASIKAEAIINYHEKFDRDTVEYVLKYQKEIEERLDDQSPIYFATTLTGQLVVAIKQSSDTSLLKSYQEITQSICRCINEIEYLQGFSDLVDSNVAFDVFVSNAKLDQPQSGKFYSLTGTETTFTSASAVSDMDERGVDEWITSTGRQFDWTSFGDSVRGKTFFVDKDNLSDRYSYKISDSEYIILLNSNLSILEWAEAELNGDQS